MTKKGMTLVEMITVITIIAALAAVLLPVLGKARNKAKSATAQRNIDQLVTALTSYASDYGFYPLGNGIDSNGLIDALESTAGGKGPYIKIPFKQKVSSGSDDSWKDPWGNAYRYRYQLSGGDSTQADCLNRGIQFQIWSIGPDGKGYGGPSDTNETRKDDITNW